MDETYFLVATVTANSEENAVDAFRNADPPAGAPTIYELRQRIATELIRFGADAIDNSDPRVLLVEAEGAADRIVEIVTLGNV